MQLRLIRLAVLALVLAPSAAWAGKTITHDLVKRPHQFTVPDGWTSTTGQNNVEFKSPDGTVTATVIGQDAADERDASELASYWGNYIVKEAGGSGIKMTAPSGIRFVDTDGAYVTLTSSDAGKKEAALVLVAKAGGVIYIYIAAGPEDRVWDQRTQTGLDEIRLGVRLAGSGGGAAAKAPEAKPEKQTIDHPGWGLKVDGLAPNWQVRAEGGTYVLFSRKPQAAVRVEYLLERDPAKVAKKSKGKPGKFGNVDAVVADGTTADGVRERAFYIPRPKHGDLFVVRFSSVTFAESEGLVADLGRAFTLADPGRRTDGGVTKVPLPHGVTLNSPKGWTVVRVGAEEVELEGPESSVFVVRVFRLKAHERYPYQDDRYTQERKCKYAGRTFSEREDSKLEHAGRAKVYTCKGPEGGALLYLVASKSQTQPVYVSVVGFYDRSTNEVPEALASDLIKAMELPRSDK